MMRRRVSALCGSNDACRQRLCSNGGLVRILPVRVVISVVAFAIAVVIVVESQCAAAAATAGAFAVWDAQHPFVVVSRRHELGIHHRHRSVSGTGRYSGTGISREKDFFRVHNNKDHGLVDLNNSTTLPAATTTTTVTAATIISAPPKNRDDAADAMTTTTITVGVGVGVGDQDKDENKNENAQDDMNAFSTLAARTALCLWESDLHRDSFHGGGISSAPRRVTAASTTNWIHDASAFAVRSVLNQIEWNVNAAVVHHHRTSASDETTTTISIANRDQTAAWIRWIQSIPDVAMVDLSRDLRRCAWETFAGDSDRPSGSSSASAVTATAIPVRTREFLSRMQCRLLFFPSGAELTQPLEEIPGSLVFGKLLYGGMTRYSLLGNSQHHRQLQRRRVGEIMETQTNHQNRGVRSWILYGGSPRMYQAVDMGPAAVLEVILLPAATVVQIQGGTGGRQGSQLEKCPFSNPGIMQIDSMAWKPEQMFALRRDDTNPIGNVSLMGGDETLSTSGSTPASLSGHDRNEAFRSHFQSNLGGLQPQIDAIVRRVLDGRVLCQSNYSSSSVVIDQTANHLSRVSLEAEELALLGLTPVRGLLLYGPPGCGKTALAREIAIALRARAPKIVAAPELLDRWVGGSEKLVRSLFAEAEAELAACNGDVTQSALHVIIIDEIDAVFRKRSSTEEGGEATRSSVVNQILAKLDGVNSIPNVLVVGMTNRRELLDEALLRPGRLEVQIEIPLPDHKGRREILQIHFGRLREKGRLSLPLCCAIDGVLSLRRESLEESGKLESDKNDTIISFELDQRGRKRWTMNRMILKMMSVILSPSRIMRFRRPVTYDLAADYATGGFSGADIAGLVRSATSIALDRARKDGHGVDGMLITLEDVKQALCEVKR